MATITEDYCSREIYRLLLEKGFDGEIHTAYDKEGYTQASITLQMAMKWLREVHNIYIVPMIENNGNYISYLYDTKGNNVQGWDRRLSKTSYEQACEAAIKYCLENLI